MHHLQSYLESNPAMGYLASGGAIFTGIATWLMNHADDLGRVFGLCAALLGFVAGYYTMRIQRRTWQKMNKTP